MRINIKNLSLFWSFISERHNIYKRKNLMKMPYPWTNDVILNSFKFTNVWRDLDPGTMFVIEGIIPKIGRTDVLLFNLIIYRLYNKIGTNEAVGIQNPELFSRSSFEKTLRELVSGGEKVFTSAFIVSGYDFLASEGDKIARTSKIIDLISKRISSLSSDIEMHRDSSFTFDTVRSLPGIGDFLAYQICVDLGYAKPDLFDEDSYVVAGPGCKRGIDRIFAERGDLSYEECISWLKDNQEEGFRKAGIDIRELFSDRKEERLNLMAIENCLCEFSKYMKALLLEGRPRNRYRIIDT